MSNEVKTIFTGDDSDLQKSFKDVGSGAKSMASDVGKASRDMADSSKGAGRDIAGAVDSSEGKFRGLGDAIGGTGDVMEGFKSGNVAQMAMGMADLAGSMSALVIPALTALKTTILTQVGPALTFLAANPIILGILAGGAIIAGLIILEKKFGLVSKAVGGLGDVFAAIWPGVKGVLNLILGGLEAIGNAAIAVALAPVSILNKIPGIKSIVPDVPKIHLPRFHSGGVMAQDGLALLQAGERVTPAGGSGSGGGAQTIIVQIGDREIGRVVADALRQNKLIGVS